MRGRYRRDGPAVGERLSNRCPRQISPSVCGHALVVWQRQRASPERGLAKSWLSLTTSVFLPGNVEFVYRAYVRFLSNTGRR